LGAVVLRNGANGKKRVLILGGAAYGARMSSPGIRFHNMARILAEEVPGARVTLAVPYADLGKTPDDLPFDVVGYTKFSALRLIAQNDIIISTGFPAVAAALFPWKTYILDYFTQYIIEWLEAASDDQGTSERMRRIWISNARRLLNIQLTFADFVLAASDRQRDSHIGSMLSLGLISPETQQQDPSLRGLIDSAPHGLRSDELQHTKDVIKGRYAGVRPTDKVIIWNGGILSWYDTETLLRAFADVSADRDDVKLIFIGASYPGLGNLGLGGRFRETVELARDLGLYNRNVFFDVGWVPYEDMKNYMLESDISVCTYFDSVETNFSLRTRFLDVFWAEVPLICTKGDILSEVVEEHRLGIAVPERDVPALSAAFTRLLDDSDFHAECKRNMRAVKACFGWEVVLKPLIDFCRNGGSIAKPKSERMWPLMRRIGWHEFARRLTKFTVWS
jgi:hypothetical protein